MHARSSAAITDPEPTCAPTARSVRVRVRRVEGALREDPAGRPAHDDGLERAAAPGLPPSATTSRSGVPNGTSATPGACRPADVDEDRARRLGRADRPECLRVMSDDPGHGGEGLHVLDDRRRVPEPARRRVRGSLLGLAALPVEGLQEHRLLAEHVGALHRPHADLDAPAAADGVLADQAADRRGVDGRFQPAHGIRCGGADGDEPLLGADREAGDGHALDHRVRVGLEQRPIRARRRVRAVAVRNDVPALRRCLRSRAPLRGREVPRTASPAQPTRLDLGDRAGRPEHPDRLPQRLEGTGGQRGLEIGRIRRARPRQQDRRPALGHGEDPGHASPRARRSAPFVRRPPTEAPSASR